jgi:serine/threonine protein kinase
MEPSGLLAGRYEKIQTLGRGSFGLVQLARDICSEGPDSLVAIKVGAGLGPYFNAHWSLQVAWPHGLSHPLPPLCHLQFLNRDANSKYMVSSPREKGDTEGGERAWWGMQHAELKCLPALQEPEILNHSSLSHTHIINFKVRYALGRLLLMRSGGTWLTHFLPTTDPQEVFLLPKFVCLVMEYAPNGSLTNYIQRKGGRLEVCEAQRMLSWWLAGLGLHRHCHLSVLALSPLPLSRSHSGGGCSVVFPAAHRRYGLLVSDGPL